MKKAQLDLSMLKESVQGKKHLLIEMLDIFLKELPEILEKLETAAIHADYKAVKQWAHRLISSVSILGIQDMRVLLIELQTINEENVQQVIVMQTVNELKELAKSALEEVTIENEKLKS